MAVPYLLPEDDGLPMRDSNDYAKDKLRILERYVYRFTTSMRQKPWRALFYIDLLAGPGKNSFEPSKNIMLGSPLIALTTRFPFTHYRFVEKGIREFDALQQRISVSDRRNSVKTYRGDCNLVVDQIVGEIRELDKQKMPGKWSCLNLAFLDPEGLELQWQTVEKLGMLLKMDLIINFSTSGITRNARQYVNKEQSTRLDHFFGTPKWKDVFRQVMNEDDTTIRRAVLDFYKERLTSLGYQIDFECEIAPDEKVFRNRRNRQIYTLMFASKNPLGNDFWKDVLQEVSQPKLL